MQVEGVLKDKETDYIYNIYHICVCEVSIFTCSFQLRHYFGAISLAFKTLHNFLQICYIEFEPIQLYNQY